VFHFAFALFWFFAMGLPAVWCLHVVLMIAAVVADSAAAALAEQCSDVTGQSSEGTCSSTAETSTTTTQVETGCCYCGHANSIVWDALLSNLSSPVDPADFPRWFMENMRQFTDMSRKSDEAMRHAQSASMQDLENEYRYCTGRPTPRNFGRWVEFARQHQCPLSFSAYSDIEESLRQFRGLSPTAFKELMSEVLRLHGMHSIVIGGGIMHTPFPNLFLDLQPYLSHFKDHLPEPVHMVWSSMDEPRSLNAGVQAPHEPFNMIDLGSPEARVARIKPHCSNVSARAIEHFKDTHGYLSKPFPHQVVERSLPIIGSTRLAGGCHADILAPPGLMSDPKFPDLGDPSKRDTTPWSQKKDVVYWRGAASGGLQCPSRMKIGGWRSLHRHRYVNHSSKLGKQYDVAFTEAFSNTDKEYAELQRAEYGYVPHSTYNKHFEHKYLLDIDGNTYSRRFSGFLAYGRSLVLRASLFETWERNVVLPFVHYIPVSLDPELNTQTVEFLRKNDQVAEAVAAAAHTLSSRLSHQAMTCYWYRLAVEYASASGQ